MDGHCPPVATPRAKFIKIITNCILPIMHHNGHCAEFSSERNPCTNALITTHFSDYTVYIVC